MRSLSGLLVLALAVAACVDSATRRVQAVFPFETRPVRLDNGFTAYLVRAGAPGEVAYLSIVRTGARDEVELGRTGYAHFFEHMMFRGTDRYPDYDAVTSRIGAARNTFSSDDMTVYYLVASSEHLGQIVELEADRFQNLRYSEAEFRTEAGAILGEYQQGALSPATFLDRELRLVAHDVHPYRHQSIGFEADLLGMSEGYHYSRSFFRRFYRPENVVLVLAGDFDLDAAERLIRRHYSGWEAGYQPPAVPLDPEPTGPRNLLVRYPGETLPLVSVNYRGPAWSATDRLAVATQVLGALAFGPDSDLHRKLVNEEGRVHYLAAEFGLARDPALLSIRTMVNAEADVPVVQGEIEATIQRLQNEPVDPQHLADTRSHIRHSFLKGLETARDVAFSLIPFIANTGGMEAVGDYFATLDAVTAEDVRLAARTFLTEDRRTIAVMIQEES
jgi:zinc protease